jgi:hypothetical protein
VNPLVNNWTSGEISPKLEGRLDLNAYFNGCETLNNFRVMLQGGITRRPPLKHVATTVSGRLFPFTLSTGESFLIELSEKKLRVWDMEAGTLTPLRFGADSLDYLSTEYTATEVWEVQYAQYYDKVFLAHRNHHQAALVYTGSAFGLMDFNVTCDDGNEFGSSVDNYPGAVGVMQNRLWFASTNAKPYTIWVSRPPYDGEDHLNLFTTFDTVESKTETLKDPSEWPTTTDDDGDTVYDFSDTSAFIETTTESEDVTTAKCSMELELASGRNDGIRWISGMNDIFVGTAASEWVLPYSIDPTSQSASMCSSYGSLSIQPVALHSGIIFLQRGKRLREIVRMYDGTSYGATINDLSFTAEHMLKAGVKQMVSMTNPDPLVICLLKDGTLAVLCYDKDVGIQAWSHWTTDGTFVSVSTRENDEGQELYAIVKRNGTYYLEMFDFDEEETFIDRSGADADGDLGYQSLMVGNRYDFQDDAGVTIGRPKKVSEVWVRCLDTGRISTGVDKKYMQESRGRVGSDDYRIAVSGGSRKELRIRVASVDGDPLTLLAMTFNMEVN